ncbi:MAG TPA: hypothetical protein VFA75_16320 [Nevskia sp.]|nr:hypothetical protein [Nevskia sp.]
MKMLAPFLVSHVHTKKDKAGDKPGPMRSHLKLESTIQHKDLASAFGSAAGFEHFGGFWNDDGELISREILSFPLNAEVVGGAAFLKPEFSEGKQFTGVDFKDLEVELKPGRTVVLTAKLQLPKLEPADVGLVQSWEGYEITVSVSPAQQELDLPLQQEAAEAEEDEDEAPHAGLLDGGIDRTLGADQAAVQQSVQQLADAGVLKVNTPPADGVVVPGQRAPQRPRGTTKH